VQRATPETYTGRQLSFGNGGGFNGAASSYVLLDNGLLFSVTFDKQTHKDTYTSLKKLSPAITRQLFSKAEELHLSQAAFSHPGNLYYFIDLKANSASHRITWGDPRHQVPNEAETLYHQLMAGLPR
jgi:hypothetical protein